MGAIRQYPRCWRIAAGGGAAEQAVYQPSVLITRWKTFSDGLPERAERLPTRLADASTEGCDLVGPALTPEPSCLLELVNEWCWASSRPQPQVLFAFASLLD